MADDVSSTWGYVGGASQYARDKVPFMPAHHAHGGGDDHVSHAKSQVGIRLTWD